MKKFISMLLCTVMIGAVCCGCSADGSTDDTARKGLKIVTTIFPLYDWAKNIADGSGADVVMLIDTGADLHSFQPTADDMVGIASCDVFLYIGGESDGWVNDALKGQQNGERKAVNLMESLADLIKEEETVEGMEAEDEEDESDEGGEYDEHIWLSLKNAAMACEVISAALCEADPAHAALYTANTERYTAQLDDLNTEYEQATSQAAVKTLVFADRFPFRYLVDDYGLSYYAAFAGCFAESEASFETIVFLANKVDELGLQYIMKIESSDGSIANTVRENTRDKQQDILTLDSLQSVTKEDVDSGVTYLNIMTENLSVLKTALTNGADS